MLARFKYYLFFLIFLLANGSSIADVNQDFYILCGSDEDGCSRNNLSSCACITMYQANTAYCLDFNLMICEPLAEKQHCDPHLVFETQAHCLAMLFQSESDPPCEITTKQFCVENNLHFCEATGRFNSCKKNN